jgi:predicted transcriptional regulator
MKLKLREMIASGISKTEIAKNLAISRASVYQYIKAM